MSFHCHLSCLFRPLLSHISISTLSALAWKILIVSRAIDQLPASQSMPGFVSCLSDVQTGILVSSLCFPTSEILLVNTQRTTSLTSFILPRNSLSCYGICIDCSMLTLTGRLYDKILLWQAHLLYFAIILFVCYSQSLHFPSYWNSKLTLLLLRFWQISALCLIQSIFW